MPEQTSHHRHHLAWVSLGSNIDPEQNLPYAVKELAALGVVLKASMVWQSPPVGDLRQADFCNAAVQLQTGLAVDDLKRKLRCIETRLGRVRDPENKNAARTIDLDIAFYDDVVCQHEGLCIPDPEIASRPFLAVPLAELDPTFRHPITGKTLAEIAAASGGAACLTPRSEIVLAGG